jgi:surfactin synthase thioesterase subunit
MRSSQSSWLGQQPIITKGVTQVICFPFAGGGASAFGSWRKLLTPELNLVPLCPPGRERRRSEPPVTNADIAAEQISRELIQLTDQPLVFFGHSLGAQLAFETAHKLNQMQGSKLSLLIISGSTPPSNRQNKKNWHLLPDEEFIHAISKLGGTPSEVLLNRELMDLFIPALRADFKLLASLSTTKRPALSCPIIAFGGHDDPLVTPQELNEWSQETTNTFDSVIFPGKHFFIQESKGHIISKLNTLIPSIVKKVL